MFTINKHLIRPRSRQNTAQLMSFKEVLFSFKQSRSSSQHLFSKCATYKQYSTFQTSSFHMNFSSVNTN